MAGVLLSNLRGWALAGARVRPSRQLVVQKRCTSNASYAIPLDWEAFQNGVLNVDFMMDKPDTQVHEVVAPVDGLGTPEATFNVIRDDLLHPLLGGNKLRKMDALMSSLIGAGVTDVVTCGGLQSSHTAAVACMCAEAHREHGLRAHLLVRGERPAVPTGYHLLTRMYGEVTYISRTEYRGRDAMFERHVVRIRSSLPPDRKVAVIKEGASQPDALYGILRLVGFLATPQGEWGRCYANQPCKIVVDSGTGTTAIGMALGAALLGLPWEIVGVMLAGSQSYYEQQQQELLTSFLKVEDKLSDSLSSVQLPLTWRERVRPRRFGEVLPGEIEHCRKIASSTGVLVDPIYTLAAWEVAQRLAAETDPQQFKVMQLHTGGALGLQGLAQRYPDQF